MLPAAGCCELPPPHSLTQGSARLGLRNRGGGKTLSGVTKSCSFSAFLQGWESVWPLKSRLRAWCAGVSSQKGFTYGIAPRNPSRDSCFHKLDIEQRGALLLRRPGAQ